LSGTLKIGYFVNISKKKYSEILIQMITYNLFRERKFKIDREEVWMTPFQLAGAKYTDAQEA
jgi:hypothetical protein